MIGMRLIVVAGVLIKLVFKSACRYAAGLVWGRATDRCSTPQNPLWSLMDFLGSGLFILQPHCLIPAANTRTSLERSRPAALIGAAGTGDRFCR